MPTDPASPTRKSRLSILAAFLGFALFLVLVALLNRTPSTPVVDLKAVPETDRWKYSADGRARHLSELRARELKLSSSYSWIDKDKGLVRLPIDRAMELTLLETSSSRKP